MMMRPALLALAACGSPMGHADDTPIDMPPALSCGTTGAATVSGSIAGETIAPVARAIQTTFAGVTPVIMIDDGGTGCTAHNGMTDMVSFVICTPMVATYPIENGIGGPCPDPEVTALSAYTLSDNMYQSASGRGGTFTIDSIDATCMKGSFSVQFETGQLSGTFAAIAGC